MMSLSHLFPRSPQMARGVVALAALIPLASLVGCAPGAGLPQVPQYDGTVYHLGVGDQVRVITYGDQQLSTDFRIGDSGAIAVPLLGSVRAAGLTSVQLASSIANELRTHDLIRKPSVSVEVTSYRPISVLGETSKPGQYAYQPGMTMLTAIAVAGGFTYRAVEGYAMVVRQNGPTTIIGRISPQDYVMPGDVIKVYERYF